MKRGEIWWADLLNPRLSEPGFRRPVLIIQDDCFNESDISTVVCVVITSNLRLQFAPGNIFLSSELSSLPKDSIVNISQIITVDKSCFVQKISKLNNLLMFEVEAGLRLILDLF